MSKQNDSYALLARIDDLCTRADRGELGISDFLSPSDRHFAEKYLQSKKRAYVAFGGYGDAERQRIYLLPEYIEHISSADELLEYGHSCDVVALELVTDGYRRLSHRDYLGSLLGIGIERDVVGDIIVYGEGGDRAAVFCDSRIAVYIGEELARIAGEKVRVREIPLENVEIPERRFAEISDTVASARLDCIVAAVCSLSRERARAAVESGLVELDFECEERADRAVCAPCMLSVRGFGRFKINSVSDKTKKGRYRLLASKYL